MAGGLDTRTGMDGFARGMQLGNNIFNQAESKKRYEDDRKDKANNKLEADARYEERVMLEQGRYDVQEKRNAATFDHQEEAYERKQTLGEVNSIYQSWLNGDTPQTKDIDRMKQVSAMPGFKQFNVGINLNPETGKHLDSFGQTMKEVSSGNYENVNSAESLSSFNYLYRDFIKGNGKDGLKRKVVGIVPARNSDGSQDSGNVHLKLEVTNPQTGEKYFAPATENGGTESSGDNNVRSVPIKKIMEIGLGRRQAYEEFNKNPEVKKKLQSIMVQNGMIKAPAKSEYAVGAWGDGNIMYNKTSGKVANTSDGRVGNAGSGSSKSYKILEKDFNTDRRKMASMRTDLAADGMEPSPEDMKSYTKEWGDYVHRKYGVDLAVAELVRKNKSSIGDRSESTLKELQQATQIKSEEKQRLISEQSALDQDAKTVQSMEEASNNAVTMPTRTRGMHNESKLESNSEFADAVPIQNALDSGKSGGRKMHPRQRKILQARLSEIKSKLPNQEQAPARIKKLDAMISDLKQEDPKANQAQIKYYENYKAAINKFVLNDNNNSRGMFADTTGQPPSQI